MKDFPGWISVAVLDSIMCMAVDDEWYSIRNDAKSIDIMDHYAIVGK